MKKYSRVINGNIEQPKPLPRNVGKIIGFNKLTDEELAEHNYYPVEDSKPSINNATQYLTSSKRFEDNVVYVDYVINDYTEQQLKEQWQQTVSTEITRFQGIEQLHIEKNENDVPLINIVTAYIEGENNEQLSRAWTNTIHWRMGSSSVEMIRQVLQKDEDWVYEFFDKASKIGA